MPEPRVSIIITSYNQQVYLEEAIESVLSQTLRAYEVIVADDHSTADGSIELIHDYMAQYPDLIRAVFQPRNVRAPRNRNTALRLVRGDYVGILDGDDRLLPTYLEEHVKTFASDPEIGCSYTNRYQIDAAGTRLRTRDDLAPSGDLATQIAFGLMGLLRSMIIRYDLMKAAGFMDERFLHHDGLILTMRLSRLTKIGYIAEPLMEKREHAAGVSRNFGDEERAQCFEDIRLEALHVMRDWPSSRMELLDQTWRSKIAALRNRRSNQLG